MSNRPAQPPALVRRIKRMSGYLTSAEYEQSRHCRGKRRLCSALPCWEVTHHVRRGYRRSFYCEECLPKKHRVVAARREVLNFINDRLQPCQDCGCALWRHVEEQGHKFVAEETK